MPKENFSHSHFADSLQKYPFQGGGCRISVDHLSYYYHKQNAKMPFMPDQHSNSTDRQLKAHQQIKEDVHDPSTSGNLRHKMS
jgi:DNA polymerase-3 subunit alpha/error-prone DNA polymerase